MKKLMIGLIGLIGFIGEINSGSAQICKSYVDKTIDPTSYEDVEKLLSKVPLKKGEFETTVDFDSRIETISSTWPESFLIDYSLNKKYLKYDADNQTMTLEQFAFSNIGFNYSVLFEYGKPPYDKIDVDTSRHGDNLQIVVSQTETSTGSYEATNSMGASISVELKERLTKVILDRAAKQDEEMFVNLEDPFDPVDVIKLPPKNAKILKENAKAAVLIFPKKPYFAKGVSGRWEPTFERPTDIQESGVVIIADIQCAFLLDGNDKVVSAYTIR